MGGDAKLMFYSLAQYSFRFFFQPDYQICWITTPSDCEFKIGNSFQADYDSRFSIENSGGIDHDSRLRIFALGDIDHDTAFPVQAVALCDIRYAISAGGQIDHHTQLVVGETGQINDHAILFTIRQEDEFTN